MIFYFLCPRFETVPYFRDRFIEFKTHFGSMAHSIAGGQDRPSKDPTALGWLSEEELFARYASSAAFVYTRAASLALFASRGHDRRRPGALLERHHAFNASRCVPRRRMRFTPACAHRMIATSDSD
jgi:hypothetical protein